MSNISAKLDIYLYKNTSNISATQRELSLQNMASKDNLDAKGIETDGRYKMSLTKLKQRFVQVSTYTCEAVKLCLWSHLY